MDSLTVRRWHRRFPARVILLVQPGLVGGLEAPEARNVQKQSGKSTYSRLFGQAFALAGLYEARPVVRVREVLAAHQAALDQFQLRLAERIGAALALLQAAVVFNHQVART